MSDEPLKPDFTPPAESQLPQGTQEFLSSLEAVYTTVEALFAPYMKHPGVARNFDQVILKLREAGLWVNDTMNMVMNPQLFQPENPDAPSSEG